MSSRRVRSSIWGKLSKLAFRKKAGSRKRQVFRTSLLEQFEKRELMAYSVSSIQLVNDTGISSTDKITFDPTLSGSVSNSSGGSSGGYGGGMYGGGGFGGGLGGSVLHVQFDHNGDGVGDGSVIVNGTSFQYDPRISDPGLYFHAGAINIKQRVLEYNYMNQLVSTGSWSDFNFTLETAASGEIQIRDNNQNILISQTSFDFGAVTVGSSVSRTFTIDNLASPMNPAAILRLKTTDIQVPPGYSLSQTYAGTVSPGQQTTFTINLDTSTPGPKWGTFSFKNSDGDENPFTLNFTANVLSIEPEIDIRLEATGQTIADNSGSLAFGSTEVGTPIQRQIRISNQGNSPLTLGTPSVGSGFTITSFVPNSLAANSSVVVTIQMNAASVGSFDVPFSITSNDSNESPYNFALTGSVTNAAPPYVDNLTLFHDTGVSSSDRITTDPRLYGIVRGNYQGGTARIEFDHHRTGTINGSLIVTNSGDSFTYDPRVTDSTIAEYSGRWTLRYRVVHLNANGESLATSNWIDFAMILDGIAETAGLSLSQFGLVRDTGSSVIDRLTTDPTIQATLTGDRAGGKVRLEFDHQGNGAVSKFVEFPAGATQVQYDPRSGDASLIGYVGSSELRYRLTKLDANDNPISSSRWITFAYQLAALPSSTVEVRNFRLAQDTGTSDSDRVTSDPTLTGNLHDTATVPADTSFTLVQFDHNGDGVPDGSALTDGLGVFTYRPKGLSYNSHTLRVRSTPYSVEYASYLIGPWASLSMQLIAPPAPKIESLALVSDTGTSSTDKITDNPTIVGTMKLDDRPVSDYIVYVDHNGDGTTEGTAITDRFGNFIYRPRNLTPGPIKLTLLTAYWDSNLNSTVYASPVEFEYTLLAPPLPTIEWLDIAIDDGSDRLDRRTTHSTIVGQLGTSSLFQNIQVEFDHDNNGTVDGIAFSDAAGAILYRPFGLAPGAVTIKARTKIWNVDQVQWNTGPWMQTQFTLEASASSSLGIGLLGLRRDTGTSTSDLVTSEATLAGQIQYSGSAVSASLGGLGNQRVEFDENGDNEVDGYTFTEADGKFLYTPKFLAPGAKSIRARTRSWNTQTHQGELSAWSTVSFTLGADPVIAPAIQSLTLLSDSGPSATDGNSRNPAFTGVVPIPSGATATMLEIDFNNDGVSDALTTTDSDGRFVVHPNFSTFGPKTVAVRSFVYRPDSTAREFSNWQTLSFNYSDEPSQPASITGIQWTPATRTASPVLKGRIIDDSSVANVQIEIDLNDDGVAEAVVTSDSQGRFQYTYVPPTSTSPTSVTLKLRTKQALEGASPQVSAWSTHTFSNPAPSAPTPSSLGVWGLANDDGASATDRISTDLTLKGSIQAGSITARLDDQLIQFDHDGDGKPDGSTLTDAQGNFTYPLTLPTGEHTVKTRLISFDPDLGLIQGAWSSLVVTQSVLVETKIATLGLVADTGNASDGATANVALQGTLTGPSVGHVLVFIDVNGDGAPDGHTTTNASGAFTFTPETPTAEGFVQANAWIARGGSPGDSTSKTYRFVYSSAPDGTSAQALVTQLASFDSAWQAANTTLEQGLTAAQNALKTSLQNADSTYRTEISAAYSLFQSTRLSTVTAYRESLRSAEFQLNTSLSLAESNFLNQTSGQAQGTEPLFVWPITPPEDAFVIPKDEDQPQPPAYFGIDAGPTLNVSQHPAAMQLYAIAESNAATALATAEATYQQALASAAAASAAAKQTAYQQFASSVSTARNTRAAAEANLQHPTLNAATESRQSAAQLQTQRDLKSSTSVAAEQEFSNKAQTAFNTRAQAQIAAQQQRESGVMAAWAAFNQGIMFTYGNPAALQALIQTRDNSLRSVHEAYFRKIADANFTYTIEIATAAKVRDFIVADAEHEYETTVANRNKLVRDIVIYVDHWVRGQKILAGYNEQKANALAAEKRARDEAKALYDQKVLQINAAYDREKAIADALEGKAKEQAAVTVSILTPFADFMRTPAAEVQLGEATADKTATDSKSTAKGNRDRGRLDKQRTAALAAANDALQHAYRVAEAERIADVGIADKQKTLREQASDALKDLQLDQSQATYAKEIRDANGKQLNLKSVAQTSHDFAVAAATPTKNRAYTDAVPQAFMQVFPNSNTSYYGQAIAQSTYTYEIEMITVDRTYREEQADNQRDKVVGQATNEFLTTSDFEQNDHSARSLIITYAGNYDSFIADIVGTASKSQTTSSATYNEAVLNGLSSMSQQLSELDRIFGNSVANADLDKDHSKTNTRSTKKVQTYQSYRDRIAGFAAATGTPWGTKHLKLAEGQLLRESTTKEAVLKRSEDSADEQRVFVNDYLQQIKTTSDTQTTSSLGYVTDTLMGLKDYSNDVIDGTTLHLQNQAAINQDFQLAISEDYVIWKVRLAEIKREKQTRDAEAIHAYQYADAEARATVEPSYAAARRDLAIASAKYNAQEITASQWQQANTDYAAAIAAAHTQLADLLAPKAVIKRQAEGEAIRLEKIDTAKAEETWVQNSSAAYLVWVQDSGDETKRTAGEFEQSGGTFVTTETNLASSTHRTIENAVTGFVQDTSADQAGLLEKLTQHANTYASTMTNVQGNWLYTKVDARAEYENVLADTHKLRKETLHQQSPTPLTTLQYSVAQADSTRYLQRRAGQQQRATAWKTDAARLTTSLNHSDLQWITQSNTVDLSWIDGSTNASAAASNGGASAFSTLRRDSSKANLKRSQEEIGTAVDLVYAVAQADVAHAVRVQAAKVIEATAVGAALKQKHIDQYTAAANAAADAAIAAAHTQFKAHEKTSKVTRAENVGDAAIAAAQASGQNLLRQVNAHNSASGIYTAAANNLESTLTATINSLTIPYTQNTRGALTTAEQSTAAALRTSLADFGTADVSWITTLANADAARTGAQAAAQGNWVTSSVQAGGSSLMFRCGDLVAADASGSWASQYAPTRTAMITATAVADAGRQITAWLDRSSRDNAQADADVHFIHAIAPPETQLAVLATQRGNQHATASTNTAIDLSTDLDHSGATIHSTSAAIEKSSAIDSATAWKAYQVALASLDEGAATTAVEKAYQDALAQVTRNSRVAYANLTYTESVAQIGSVGDAITDMGQAGKTYITNLAGDEKAYTDTAAPIIGARTLLYTQADNDLRKAITTADNVWRDHTAQAWGTHTAGDLVARGAVRRTLANTSSLVADASQASIAELKAQWWQNEIPNYLQWSVDISGIETTYTNSTTANILLRATGIKTAGVAYASTVGTAIQAFETTTATAREQYLSTLMTVSETAAEATLRADRDKEIALADADLQKQLTGNESAHTTAVNNANSAHSTATANAEAARKSAEQAALSQLNSTLAQATKDKEASIAGAERTYDQVVASLDAQYGSESSHGDTGVEGATRRSAIKTRDAQYYAARDTSWANNLSGSNTLGTTPWSVKAISAANAQAAYSNSRASAQAAHDAAMLDAIEDWQLSSRELLTDLLFTEGQSRETFNVATSNVYANWENGVGNLLGDKPEGTGYVPVLGFGEGGVGTVGGVPAITTTRFQEGDDKTLDSEVESEDDGTPRPILPPSEGPIVWLTQQQMLELERQHGPEMVDRFRSFYRIRDPNIGFLPGDLINSLPNDSRWGSHRPEPTYQERKRKAQEEYDAAMVQYNHELFDYYQQLMQVLVLVGDELALNGITGVCSRYPWLAGNYNCTAGRGIEKGSDNESVLGVEREYSMKRPFPVNWFDLREAMIYSMHNYGNFDDWWIVDRSSQNLHGTYIFAFWPYLYLSDDQFYGKEFDALADLIHEPLHDIYMYGPFHGGPEKEIVPMIVAAESRYGSSFEQLYWFLVTAVDEDGSSLWSKILMWAGPRPTVPLKPEILQ